MKRLFDFLLHVIYHIWFAIIYHVGIGSLFLCVSLINLYWKKSKDWPIVENSHLPSELTPCFTKKSDSFVFDNPSNVHNSSVNSQYFSLGAPASVTGSSYKYHKFPK